MNRRSVFKLPPNRNFGKFWLNGKHPESTFSCQENPNMEKAGFHWPIVLQFDVKAKYRLISRKFSGMKFFSPKTLRVCIRSINQSNRSISVRLLFLFYARVFISRSYENRSILLRWRQNGMLMTSSRGEFRVGLIPIAMEMPKCQRKWLWNLPYLFD